MSSTVPAPKKTLSMGCLWVFALGALALLIGVVMLLKSVPDSASSGPSASESSTTSPTYLGKRGGAYHISPSGKRVYNRKK